MQKRNNPQMQRPLPKKNTRAGVPKTTHEVLTIIALPGGAFLRE